MKKFAGLFVALETSIIMLAYFFTTAGGEDLYRFYIPFSWGCVTCGFTPPYAGLVLWPLKFLAEPWGWPVWAALTMAGIFIICHFTKVNPVMVLLSFPTLAQLWLGQIDIFICAGLALAVLAKSPYWRSLGLLLALVKPQITWLAVIVLALQYRKEIKVFIFPAAAILLTFVVYGLTWPLDWLINASKNLTPATISVLDIWPYGLSFALAVFIIKPGRPRVEAALMLAALSNPYYRGYSYLSFLIFRAPWWSVILSYAWLLFIPVFGYQAVILIWVMPAVMVGYLLVKEFRGFKVNQQEIVHETIG